MTEEQYTIKLPDTVRLRHSDWTIEGLTDKQVQALHDQCEAILSPPKPRQWRDGDIIRFEGTDIIRVRACGKWHHLGGNTSASDADMGCSADRYLGNLRDLLAEGDSLLAFNKEELERIFSLIRFREDKGKLILKIEAALARYRESQ